MKTKVVQLIPAVLALATIGFRYFGLWCTNVGNPCYRGWLDQSFLGLVNPLDSFGRYFFLLTLILIFVSWPVFKSWLKFAAWVLPFVFLDIVSTPVWPRAQGLLGMFPGGPGRTEIAATDGKFFLASSLLVIVFSFIRECLTAAGKRSRKEIEDIVKELWALAGAIAGFIFAVLFFQVSFIPLTTIDAILLYSFGALVLGIPALGYASFLAYRKMRSHARLEWRLALIFLSSTATILVFTLRAVMGG